MKHKITIKQAIYHKIKIKQAIAQVIEQRVSYPGEDVDLDIEVADLGEAWLLLGWADHYAAAARAVQKVLKIDIAARLGKGGKVRFGDSFVKYDRPNEYKLTEGFDDWAKDNLTVGDVLAILSRSGFRVTALREVAKRYGMDEKTIEGSLFVNERDLKDPSVQTMPLYKAPKYAAEMTEGEIRK